MAEVMNMLYMDINDFIVSKYSKVARRKVSESSSSSRGEAVQQGKLPYGRGHEYALYGCK